MHIATFYVYVHFMQLMFKTTKHVNTIVEEKASLCLALQKSDV